jgi:hypothetical protein
LFDQYKYVNPLSYLDGALTRDEYIEKYRFEYPTLRYINENFPPEARILFIFLGNRGYYCNREYVFDMKHNTSTLRQLVKRSCEPKKVLLGLKEMGITHLLINYEIFDKWVKDSFTIKEQELLKGFFEKHIRLLYFKWGYGVSQLENFD